MIGYTIKDYKIIKEIGKGGMATVYLAEHVVLNNNSAIKVLNLEYVRNENIRKRFLAEARNMARMSHPNIIKVTDLIDDEDTVCFVMDYIEGETLKQYLDRKGKLRHDEIKSFFNQMLEAVGYVHEQNLIHRDIKPSNFMIDKHGKVKLLDFGIAKNTDISNAEYTQTGTYQNMGTPMYMSPEQVKSTKDVTLQSDIYSLGVVLWQMVMGQKPYEIKTTSTFELQTKIVNEKLHLTGTIFDRIIELSTEKELSLRFNNCTEVKANLAYLQTSSTENVKSYVRPDSGKKLLDSQTDNTVVESHNETHYSAKRDNTNPPKRNSKSTLFIILFVIFVIIAGIISSNNSSNYQSIPDVDSTEMIEVDSFATDSTMGSSPYVTFQNNSSLTVYLSYAFWDNGWETIGWYAIEPQESFGFNLPNTFTDKSIYWYATNSEGAKYEGSDSYFCIDPQNAFHFYTNENCIEQAGFYKLDLTGSYTTQNLGQ
jgi:serine/threonine protein kinase